jgi:glycosyltransferase involved in cell wall biosynthesis
VVTAKAASVEIEVDHEALPSDAKSLEPAGDLLSGHEVRLYGGGDPVPVKLSIVMAAYNEERTIVQGVKEILEVRFPCEIEIIVVDDGSTDGTPDHLTKLNDPRVIVHRHGRNRGKGAAILTAAGLATGTHIVPFDADMEYDAEDLARMMEPVIKGRYDVVYGARLFGCNTVYHNFRYAVGNKVMTQFANILYDSYLSDLHTCLKLMPLALFRSLNLTEFGFGLDTQVTARLLRSGVRPFEVPVSYYSRSHEEGKKITWRDGVSCLWILVRTRLSNRTLAKSPRAAMAAAAQASADKGA